MKLGQDENRNNPPCWKKDVQARALRVELADGSFYVFPYNHFVVARFASSRESDTVHVVLDTHEVQIAGKHLRAVGLAFQDLAVDWMRELPARYSPQADDDDAWITSITVSEVQERA
jgi:hypothetical protein